MNIGYRRGQNGRYIMIYYTLSLLVFCTNILPTFATYSNGTAKYQYECCFVKSVFATDVSNADRIPNATTLAQENIQFGFFLFTNLNLYAPGWKLLVRQNLPYKGNIVKSRVGKFMAWKEPEIQECKAVLTWLTHKPELFKGLF